MGPKNLTIKGYQKKIQLGFSSEIEVPQLGSARNPHSSTRLELKNSGSGSSLLISNNLLASFVTARVEPVD